LFCLAYCMLRSVILRMAYHRKGTKSPESQICAKKKMSRGGETQIKPEDGIPMKIDH